MPICPYASDCSSATPNKRVKHNLTLLAAILNHSLEQSNRLLAIVNIIAITIFFFLIMEHKYVGRTTVIDWFIYTLAEKEYMLNLPHIVSSTNLGAFVPYE